MSAVLATSVPVGQHMTLHILGGIYLDTVISSLVAFGVVLGVGLYLRSRLTSGVPGRLQAFLELIWEAIDGYVRELIGPFARWVVPLAATLFFFILVCNWLELIPTGDRLTSATADLNTTAALAVIVIFLVHYTSIKRRGWLGYLRTNYLHPPGMPWFAYILLGPINVISQISYPISLSLRLFGNMLAAVIMLEIIALMPIYIGFIFNGVWKAFEGAFVDVVQAFIFALLTVIYLSLAAGDDEHHAAEAAPG